MSVRFPDGFLWGASTSAFQIEGALGEDGRGRSIWDRFSEEPGRIARGERPAVACDHYHRVEEDLDLVESLGCNAYRFSLAWSRICPEGSSRVEGRGLAHYDREIDAVLERGLTPVVTLYHWDLPEPLQEAGGWAARATAEAFGTYASACFEAFGDRVPLWVSINEPWIAAVLGHELGVHAPGHRDLAESAAAAHHLLLAHARAAEALSASRSAASIGVAHSLFPHEPASESPADVAAALASDGYVNRWYLDPLQKGAYPADQRERYEERIGELVFVREGDLEAIAARSDFIGVNYYTRRRVASAPDRRPWPWEVLAPEAGVPVTDAGWEIVPSSFSALLGRLAADYPAVPLLVTENGGVFNDEPGDDGEVADDRRSAFLHGHLAAMASAIEGGAPVIGYCHWSLLDNFEWALGYEPRFGLVHVDYSTQARTLKASGHYYRSVTTANAL